MVKFTLRQAWAEGVEISVNTPDAAFLKLVV